MKARMRLIAGAFLMAGVLSGLPVEARIADAHGLDLAITTNDACAAGECCFEPGSLCPQGNGQFVNHRYYELGCPIT